MQKEVKPQLLIIITTNTNKEFAMQQGRYFLGRVIKLGVLTQDLFMNAIANSPTVTIGKFNWTITDVVDKRNDGFPYIFGKLSKFASEGYVTVVDIDAKSQIDEPTENLLIASAPFVYLPNFSGIAYLHVWNQIQEELFPRRFKTIIEAAYDNFFVDCTIEPISDYRAFAAKLREINTFTDSCYAGVIFNSKLLSLRGSNNLTRSV